MNQDFRGWAMMKRAVPTLLAAVSVSVLGMVSPASANNGVNLGHLKVASLRVNSSSCRDINMSVPMVNSGGYTDLYGDASFEIWRGSKSLGDAFLDNQTNGRRLTGSYFWCDFDGLGKFRAGPTSSGAWDGFDSGYNFVSGSLSSSEHVAFKVQQASKAHVTVQKTGHLRTFRAHALKYSVTASAWVAYKGIKVSLQRLSSAGNWVSIHSANADSRGNVTLRTRAMRYYRYRMYVSHAGRTWWGKSRTIKI